MLGLMMQAPLMVSDLLAYAASCHGDTEIVSRRVEGDIHRYTYAEAWLRTQKLANALARLGFERGDRIGTLAWNGYRHFEIYYAVSGSGLVCHTVNPQAVRRPDRLYRQPRRRPLPVRRPDLRAAARAHRRPPDERAHHRGDDRPGPYAGVQTALPAVLRGPDRAGGRTASTGRSSTRTRPRACATRPGPPATPRGCCTAIVPPSCTVSP